MSIPIPKNSYVHPCKGTLQSIDCLLNLKRFLCEMFFLELKSILEALHFLISYIAIQKKILKFSLESSSTSWSLRFMSKFSIQRLLSYIWFETIFLFMYFKNLVSLIIKNIMCKVLTAKTNFEMM